MIPDMYIPVTVAGKGTSAVYYCIPHSIIAATALADKSARIAASRNSLFAVKISQDKDLIAHEVKLLRTIQNSSRPDAEIVKRHFLPVLNEGQSGPLQQYRWLTLPAISPPVDFGDLLQASREVKVPVPLVFHFFLSLVPALHFLRDELGYAHNDIKEDNVMCRLTPDSPFGLTEFVFIDMGVAVDINDAVDHSSDWKDLLRLVGNFVDKARDCEDDEWVQFRWMLDGEKNRTKQQVNSDIDGMWSTWGTVAREKRDKMSGDEVGVARELFGRAAERKEGVTDEDLVKAMEKGKR